MMRLETPGPILAATLVAWAATAVPGAAQETLRNPYNMGWYAERGQFAQQVYLAMCTGPCPADRLMLVPNPGDYAEGVLRVLGGPYAERLEVEVERNRLVPGVLPPYSLRVVVFDESGDEIGALWLGARPSCSTPEFAQGPLTGNISSDFSPTQPGRPEALPIPVNRDLYIAAVERIRPQCLQRRRNARPIDVPDQ